MFKVFSVFLMLLTLSVSADESKTIKVKASNFVYKSELSGLILSSKIDKIKIDAKQFPTWVLKEAVSHGTAVKKGDVLATFEEKAFEDDVKVRKRNLDIQRANLKKTQKLFELNMRKMELDRKRSQLSADAAKKKALIYKEKGHDLAKKGFEQDLVDARNSLLYQQEELNQLKKMYDEDKITEETEEIVLKRQKNYVESLTKRMKIRELAVEEAMNIKLPSDLFNADYNQDKAIRDEEKNKVEWEVFAITEKLKLEAAEIALEKAEESFKKLLEERKNLEIKAESDGVVYYGAQVSGKWTNQSGTEYKKGQSFMKGAYLFSLVDTQSYNLVASANYTQIQYIDKNSTFYCEIPGSGMKELSLVSKASVPNNGSFKVVLKVEDPRGVFHGTTTKASHRTSLGEKVIAVPSSAVKRDEVNPDKEYVNILKNGKTEKVTVTTGLKYNGKTVITSGLKEGMEVRSK